VKDIVILGGPNGAGKTTTASVLLPEFLRLNDFLNADEIARDISPDNPEAAAMAAGRILIQRMREYVRDEKSFAFETTCSGKSYIPLLGACSQDGWRISLYYFWLTSPDQSVARVARRVREGGHDIPAEVIFRRFRTGVSNMLNLYLPLAHEAEIYDNTDRQRILIAEKRAASGIHVHDQGRWNTMKEIATWK
jgi:predicted ABC-type ATPase